MTGITYKGSYCGNPPIACPKASSCSHHRHCKSPGWNACWGSSENPYLPTHRQCDNQVARGRARAGGGKRLLQEQCHARKTIYFRATDISGVRTVFWTLRTAEEEQMSGSWKVLKESRRGFNRHLLLKVQMKQIWQESRLCMTGGIITVCVVILLFVIQEHLAVLVSINLSFLQVLLHILQVLLHILGKKQSLPWRDYTSINISFLDENQLAKSTSTTKWTQVFIQINCIASLSWCS